MYTIPSMRKGVGARILYTCSYNQHMRMCWSAHVAAQHKRLVRFVLERAHSCVFLCTAYGSCKKVLERVLECAYWCEPLCAALDAYENVLKYEQNTDIKPDVQFLMAKCLAALDKVCSAHDILFQMAHPLAALVKVCAAHAFLFHMAHPLSALDQKFGFNFMWKQYQYLAVVVGLCAFFTFSIVLHASALSTEFHTLQWNISVAILWKRLTL